MTGHRGTRLIMRATLALAVAGMAWGTAAPRAEGWRTEWLPGHRIVRPLAADPAERKLGAEYVLADIGELEGFALHLGAGIPLLGVRPPARAREGGTGPEFQVGVDGGIFLMLLGRDNFPMQVGDFQVGLPVDYRTGALGLRVRYGHLSSHLGDDYINRNPSLPRGRASRDEIELLASYDCGGARVYGGGVYAFHIVPRSGREGLRGGIELETPPIGGGHVRGFLAADLSARSENGFAPNEAVELGLSLGTDAGRALRLALTFFDGHAPFRQFFRERARWFGVGVFYAPGKDSL